jgi:hypothetical protein
MAFYALAWPKIVESFFRLFFLFATAQWGSNGGAVDWEAAAWALRRDLSRLCSTAETFELTLGRRLSPCLTRTDAA